MNDKAFTIRPMAPAEVDLAIDWAAAEGWNPGLADAAPFRAADAEGFLVGLLGEEPVAVISAVRYGEGFGFIGFYIVKPGYRGQGYGWQLWQGAMERLAGRTVGLDGVVAQQDNYRRSGFHLAHRNIRYQGLAGPAGNASALPAGLAMVSAQALPFATLAAYDRAFFPADRSAFLEPWLSQPGTTALALRDEQRPMAGYGVIRPCRQGWKIGPLFADSGAGAAALYDALVRQVPAGSPVFLDVPACHPEAVAFAEGRAMEKVFETARMYTGPVPDLSLERTWGITSFELG